MTDEEMAFALGEKILELQHKNAALSGILSSMRQPDGSMVPWERMLDADMPLLKSGLVSQDKYEELRQAIHALSDHSSALGRLYRHFVEE